MNALIALCVPDSTSAPVPEPVTVTPEPEAAANVPAGTPKVTLIALEPASGSLTTMPVIGEAASSVTAIDAGTVLIGASLTAPMLIVVVATLLDEVPSVTLTVTVRGVVSGASPPPAANVMPPITDWYTEGVAAPLSVIVICVAVVL